MDPVTHAVIGMSVSKLTGNHIALSDPAAMAIIIGSVFPDIDILAQKWGDYVYLKNHRGFTHSLIGLAVSAIFLSAVLCGFYRTTDFLGLFFWALLGGLSHSFFDIFNSYGAKILWPLVNKKYSLSLLVIFDPIFIGSLTGYIVMNGPQRFWFLVAFVFYLLVRVIMRQGVAYELKTKFGSLYNKISILPSMIGLFKWHFILENKNQCIVGEKNSIKGNIKIFHKFDKLEGSELENVILSPVGQFFNEFTPLFHVASEKSGEITKYTLTDMRYYIRDRFMHHAILEVDQDSNIVTASFNPYTIKRSSSIPVKGCKFSNQVLTEVINS